MVFEILFTMKSINMDNLVHDMSYGINVIIGVHRNPIFLEILWSNNIITLKKSANAYSLVYIMCYQVRHHTFMNI